MFSISGSLGAGLRRCNNDGGWEDAAAAGNVSMWGIFVGIAGLSTQVHSYFVYHSDLLT
jgi:hypothetical protein